MVESCGSGLRRTAAGLPSAAVHISGSGLLFAPRETGQRALVQEIEAGWHISKKTAVHLGWQRPTFFDKFWIGVPALRSFGVNANAISKLGVGLPIGEESVGHEMPPCPRHVGIPQDVVAVTVLRKERSAPCVSARAGVFYGRKDRCRASAEASVIGSGPARGRALRRVYAT